jgi:hypothetical protein
MLPYVSVDDLVFPVTDMVGVSLSSVEVASAYLVITFLSPPPSSYIDFATQHRQTVTSSRKLAIM